MQATNSQYTYITERPAQLMSPSSRLMVSSYFFSFPSFSFLSSLFISSFLLIFLFLFLFLLDIIVTTYNIVGLEFASNARVPSPLYTIVWKRFDNCFLFSSCSLFDLFLIFFCSFFVLMRCFCCFCCFFVFLFFWLLCLSFVYPLFILCFNLLINYNRVVLDEAHLIKNRSTQQTQAAWGLRASSKWCLTGTPIQNKVSLPLLFFILLPVFYILLPTFAFLLLHSVPSSFCSFLLSSSFVYLFTDR